MNGDGDGEAMPEDVFRWITKTVNDDFVQLGYPSILVSKEDNEFVSLCTLIKNCSSLITLYKSKESFSQPVKRAVSNDQFSKALTKSDTVTTNKKWRFLSRNARHKTSKKLKKKRKNENPYLHVIDKIKRDTEKMMEICHMCDDDTTNMTNFDSESFNTEEQALTFIKRKWKVFRRKVVNNYKLIQENKSKIDELVNQNSTLSSKMSEAMFTSCSSMQDSLNKQSSLCGSESTVKQTTEIGSIALDNEDQSLRFGNGSSINNMDLSNSFHQVFDGNQRQSRPSLSRMSSFNNPQSFPKGYTSFASNSSTNRPGNFTTNTRSNQSSSTLARRARSIAYSSRNTFGKPANPITPVVKREPRFASVPRVSELEAEVRRLKMDMEKQERQFKDEKDKLIKQNNRLNARINHLTGRKIDYNSLANTNLASMHETVKSQTSRIEDLNKELATIGEEKDFYLKLFANVSDVIVKFASDASEFLSIELYDEVSPQNERIVCILQKIVLEVMGRLRLNKETSNTIDDLKQKNLKLLNMLHLVIERLNLPERVIDDSIVMNKELDCVVDELKEVGKLKKEVSCLKQQLFDRRSSVRRSSSQLSVRREPARSSVPKEFDDNGVFRDKLFNKLSKYDSSSRSRAFSTTRLPHHHHHPAHNLHRNQEESSDSNVDRSDIKSLISDIQQRLHNKSREDSRFNKYNSLRLS